MRVAHALVYAFLLYIVLWKSKCTLPIRWCNLSFYTLCDGNSDALCLNAAVCFPFIHCEIEILMYFTNTLAYALFNGYAEALCLYAGVCFPKWKS